MTGESSRERLMYSAMTRGTVSETGAVSFLRGGGTWVDLRGADSRHHEGLPPSMVFAAPSGYLGARIDKNVATSIGASVVEGLVGGIVETAPAQRLVAVAKGDIHARRKELRLLGR